MTQPLKQKHTPFILFSGLLLGLLVEQLFFGQPLGLSLLIFVVAAGSTAWLTARRVGRSVHRGSLGYLAAALLFALGVFVRANPLLTALNLLATGFFLTLFVYYIGGGRLAEMGLFGFGEVPLRVFGGMVFKPFPLLREERERLQFSEGVQGQVMPIVRGGLLALPLLLIFLGLFVSADLIFAQAVRELFAIELPMVLLRFLGRGLIVLGSGFLLSGALVLVAQERLAEAERPLGVALLRGMRKIIRLGSTESIVILSLLNLLFISFVSIQFAYLFGGARNIHLEGFTYAEYARRGFFELLAVAIMSLGLVISLQAFTRLNGQPSRRIFSILCTLLIICVLVMLFSAYSRMRLYQLTYGFTLLRLTVILFLPWLGITLCWLAWSLWTDPRRLVRGFLLTGAGFLLTMNAINPDGFVVRQNLERYALIGDLDIQYLTTLSADAVPAFIDVVAAIQDEEELFTLNCRSLVMESFDTERIANDSCEPITRHNFFEAHLERRAAQLDRELTQTSWPAFHWAKVRAAQQLDSLD